MRKFFIRKSLDWGKFWWPGWRCNGTVGLDSREMC